MGDQAEILLRTAILKLQEETKALEDLYYGFSDRIKCIGELKSSDPPVKSVAPPTITPSDPTYLYQLADLYDALRHIKENYSFLLDNLRRMV